VPELFKKVIEEFLVESDGRCTSHAVECYPRQPHPPPCYKQPTTLPTQENYPDLWTLEIHHGLYKHKLGMLTTWLISKESVSSLIRSITNFIESILILSLSLPSVTIFHMLAHTISVSCVAHTIFQIVKTSN
jgi:hypothetical protein